MSSIIDDLITDRTQADVEKIKQLKQKIMQGGGINTLTEEEKQDYFATVVKGAYNYTDLNRIGEACAYLYRILKEQGYSSWGYVPLKTDWTVEDIPNKNDMETYINTLAALKNVFQNNNEIPQSMRFLDFNGANNIEKMLIEVKRIYDLLFPSYFYSGEINSGELENTES